MRRAAAERTGEFTHRDGKALDCIRGRESMSGPEGSEWSNGIARGGVKPEKT